MSDTIREFQVNDDHGADPHDRATFCVLEDGRLYVWTSEGGWTLPLGESHELASSMLAAMEGL